MLRKRQGWTRFLYEKELAPKRREFRRSNLTLALGRMNMSCPIVNNQMNKDVARSLIAQCVAMDEPINKMTEIIESIEDEETRKRFKRAVGNLMGFIFGEIMLPIERLFPDLNPDAHLDSRRMRNSDW